MVCLVTLSANSQFADSGYSCSCPEQVFEHDDPTIFGYGSARFHLNGCAAAGKSPNELPG